MVKGKNILIGVCAGIAAYKIPMLVRLLVKKGATVKVIMTPSAKDFVTPLTLATVSKNSVYSEFFDSQTGNWANHVELGLWADYMIIAPATANTIAKMANGISDNLLLTTYLSARCPVFVAPAMDLDMYKHTTTKNNIEKLKKYGNLIINPAFGELASGLEGDGRMEEPENILLHIEKYISKSLPLFGQKALVTAGPTYEDIDPVRFIGNHSSGKMGFAIAEELSRQGAEVTLISGPTRLSCSSEIKRIDVYSATSMDIACEKFFNQSDIVVFAAAVADYKPKEKAKNKLKKSAKITSIELLPTIDIAEKYGKLKRKKQLIVGFALETNNEEANALKKIKSKNFDFIVLNSLKDKGAGFKFNTNKIKIIDKHNKTIKFELKEKVEVARDIISHIIKLKNEKKK